MRSYIVTSVLLAALFACNSRGPRSEDRGLPGLMPMETPDAGPSFPRPDLGDAAMPPPLVDVDAREPPEAACADSEERCYDDDLRGWTCVDTSTSASHCGGCNVACDDGASCTDGACGCPAGQAVCA